MCDGAGWDGCITAEQYAESRQEIAERERRHMAAAAVTAAAAALEASLPPVEGYDARRRARAITAAISGGADLGAVRAMLWPALAERLAVTS